MIDIKTYYKMNRINLMKTLRAFGKNEILTFEAVHLLRILKMVLMTVKFDDSFLDACKSQMIVHYYNF